MKTSPIKIILVDDHTLFRDGIKSLLKSEPDIRIIAELADGNELLKVIKGLDPDMIISDISMHGMNGIELTRIMTESFPGVHVLILSMHLEENYIVDCVRLGARGYLPKDIPPRELVKAIREIYAGGTYFSHEISNIGFKSYIRHTKMEEKKARLLENLTEREIEIIRLVTEGLMNKEISDRLNISVRTVDNHKSNIMKKLDLKSSVDIVKYAIKNEIVQL
jgi:DNA-binding NarL/FixJ family response regulator